MTTFMRYFGWQNRRRCTAAAEHGPLPAASGISVTAVVELPLTNPTSAPSVSGERSIFTFKLPLHGVVSFSLPGIVHARKIIGQSLQWCANLMTLLHMRNVVNVVGIRPSSRCRPWRRASPCFLDGLPRGRKMRFGIDVGVSGYTVFKS